RVSIPYEQAGTRYHTVVCKPIRALADDADKLSVSFSAGDRPGRAAAGQRAVTNRRQGAMPGHNGHLSRSVIQLLWFAPPHKRQRRFLFDVDEDTGPVTD